MLEKRGSVVLVPALRSVPVLPFKQYWIKRTSKLRIIGWNLCLFYWNLCVHLISTGSEFEGPQGQTIHSLSKIYTCWNIKIRCSHIFCCVLCRRQNCQSGLDVLREHQLNQTAQEHLNLRIILSYSREWQWSGAHAA